jgi:hypothetical protein
VNRIVIELAKASSIQHEAYQLILRRNAEMCIGSLLVGKNRFEPYASSRVIPSEVMPRMIAMQASVSRCVSRGATPARRSR